MLRFSLFGFPITVHWMFWLVMAMLGGGFSAESGRDYLHLLIWVVAAFVSIIIHELGHAFLQRAFGARAHIHLYAMGGLAIPDRAPSRGQGILISLAGPAVQFALGWAALQLLRHSTGDSWYVTTFLWSFQRVSIFWALVNLLPIFPLDGGHILKGILGPRLEKVTYIIAIACCVALGAWVLLQPRPSLWNAMICAMFAWSNFQLLQGSRPPEGFRPE